MSRNILVRDYKRSDAAAITKLFYETIRSSTWSITLNNKYARGRPWCRNRKYGTYA